MLRETEIVKKLEIQIPTLLLYWSQKAFPCQLAGICLNCVAAAKTSKFIFSDKVVIFLSYKIYQTFMQPALQVYKTPEYKNHILSISCGFRKYPYPLQGWSLKNSEGEGVSKKSFKGKYEV